MPILLGGMLAWNLLTDWVWIGGSLGFLPKGAQEDLQKRALDIIKLMQSAKDLVYAAQKTKRQLTSTEKELANTTTQAALQRINDLIASFKDKFLLYGRMDVVNAMNQTATTLLLEIRNLRQLAGIAAGVAAVGTKIEATVSSVHDGDTLTLDNGEVVRLVGIDAPESVTEAGMASTKFLISLVLGKKVRVESDPAALKDMYNRRLGVIWLGETNINVEMLKNGYAEFYEFEPNALVYKKVWQAAAKEGIEINVKQPLADLKVVLSDSKEKLRMWRTNAKADAKLNIDAEKERFRSEEKDLLETLKDEYATTKETLKAEHADILSSITDLYKAKSITSGERAARRSEENTRYLEAKAAAAAANREAKLNIKDPHKAEKAKLSALQREQYKEIDATYSEKLTEMKLSYNESVALIKSRKKITILPEPKLPTYTESTKTSIAPEMPSPPTAPTIPTTKQVVGQYRGVDIYSGTDAEIAAQMKAIDVSKAAITPAPTPAPTGQYVKLLPSGSFWEYLPAQQKYKAVSTPATLSLLSQNKLPFREAQMSEFYTWKFTA